MAESAQLQVEICYATPDVQIRRELMVADGTTIQQAIMQSGLLRDCSAIDLTVCRVGIYASSKRPHHIARSGPD